MVQVILWLLVLMWTTEAKVSQHNKPHPDDIHQINQEPLATEEPNLSDLLPEVVAPQVPIYMRESLESTPNRESERQQTRLFKYGDIEALLVEGFIIPIVQPVGNLTDLPLPPEDQKDTLPLVDQANQEILQDTRNNKDVGFRSVIRMAVSSGSDPLMCGNYEIRSDVGVTLQTPYYPDKYTRNFKCRWILTVANSDAMVINCPDFLLAKGDVLTTTLVGKPKTLKKYVYKNGPVNQILEGNTVRVVFSSNRVRHQRGFICTVNALASTTTTSATSTPTTSATTTTPTTTTTTSTKRPSTTTTTTTSTKPPSTTTTTTTTTKPTTTTSTSTTTTVSTTTLPPLSHPDCGIANRNRIVNGQSATVNEYPWQSFLEMKWSDGKNQLCGGSLITKQWILTAGHCVLRKDDSGNLWKPEVKVTFGMHTRTTPLANGGFQVTAEAVEIHPKNNFAYDLALIKLPQEVEYKREVRPVCLPNRESLSRNVTSVLMALIGWGKTETGKLTDELRELSRYGIESAICQKVFGSYITAHHFCTSGIDEKHICLGDSGGPVMTVDKGRFTLTGVVSFVATSDCKGEYPDGHISVVHFLDWIQDMTKQVLY